MKIRCTGLTGKYDSRNLSISSSGKHLYPSKKMFKKFLENYKDIDATVKITDHADLMTGEITINVSVKYKPKPFEADDYDTK